MRLTIEKRILLIIGSFITVALAIIFFIIIPFTQRIIELNTETYNLRVYLEKKHERAVNFNLTLKTIEKISPQTTDFEGHIYHTGDALKLITTLESIANSNSVDQKINNSNLDANANPVTLSIQISGNNQSVLNYIHDLEALNYFISIRRIQLSGSNNQIDKTQNVTAVLDLSVYAN